MWPAGSFRPSLHSPRSNSLLTERPPRLVSAAVWPGIAVRRGDDLSRGWRALGSALGARLSPPHTKHQTFPPKICSEFTELTFHFRSCTFSAHVDKTLASQDNGLSVSEHGDPVALGVPWGQTLRGRFPHFRQNRRTCHCCPTTLCLYLNNF